MATFRSNLNSIPKVTYGLTAAFKKRITTCFQNWCHKHFTPNQNFYSEVTNSVKLKKIFLKKKSTNFESVRKSEKQQKYQGEKIEIVAKLLSSTLIAAATTTTTTTTTKSVSTISTQLELDQVLSNSDNMTITDSCFFQLRDEYPDLESEIRAILHARAQEGATIGEIKEDYKKMTGMHFPIYDNVTDFLLCIPWVSVLCNEKGTRIFNIVPTEKTKHLYDLVLNQKPPQSVKSSYTSRYYAPPSNRQSHQYGRFQQLQNSNKNYNNNIQYYTSNYNPNYNNNNNYNEQRQKRPRSDIASSRSESEYNCFYEDNYNYLNNRLTGQQVLPSLIANNNNNNNEINNLNSKNLNTDTEVEQYANIYSIANQITQQNEFKVPEPPRMGPTNRAVQRQVMNPYKHPGLISRPLCSSPTGTKSSQLNESIFTQDSDYEAHLLDFPLLGDDFFLYLARMELKCKFKKAEKILQSGLCVSGQTIAAAIRRVRRRITSDALMERRVIVNIGSVDIMQGKPLVQIEHDFRELIRVMLKKGITPILSTLAPLANYSHIAQVKERLERFNEFIKKECHKQKLLVIDIWSCLVNIKRQTMFDCYQHEPRNVTGTNEPYVFWNKIGRQRVLQMIESKLEY